MPKKSDGVLLETPDTPKVDDAKTPPPPPVPTDPQWNDYVMTLFVKEELIEGNPTVAGLRRVAELLIGPYECTTCILQYPESINNNRATAEVNVNFMGVGPSGRDMRFSSAADVYPGNTKEDYARHAVAMAETRAEGRALRKALKLRKISAEEATGTTTAVEPSGEQPIPLTMINALRAMCGAIGVDLIKLAVFKGFNINAPEDLTKGQGHMMAEAINEFRRRPETLPNNIKV